MLGGVCAGIARYLGVDPVAVRVGYAILTFFSGGLGILAYFVLWMVMPEE
jgi:phage shock protein PspC (stress-responsive transcriptional regulator)